MITERNKMKKVAIVIAVLVAVFMGVGGILPALAKVRDLGAIPGAFVGSYTLGVFLLSSVGMSAAFYAIRRHKAA
jgi:drug/metabolite transporter (DMT)-like permease